MPGPDLTKALLETAEDMHSVGMIGDDTDRKIAARHLGTDAPLGASWRQVHGMLKDQDNGARFTIEEINNAIADASAAAGISGLDGKRRPTHES